MLFEYEAFPYSEISEKIVFKNTSRYKLLETRDQGKF